MATTTSEKSQESPLNKKKHPTISFLENKKTEMKESKYRKKFDTLASEIKQNLVNTETTRGTIDQSQRTLVYFPTVRPDGSTDYAVFPRLPSKDDDISDVPRAAEPISFSKILIAASAIAGNIPDGETFSVNKIKARAYYELWKRSWTVSESNGQNTLSVSAQDIFTYGWGAWRVFPKLEVVDKTIKGTKTKKIIFDDVYREPLDPRRTWLGLSYRPTVNDNRVECLYEIDITKEDYQKLKKRYGKRNKETAGVSLESQNEDPNTSSKKVTITFYEDPKNNRMIIASDTTPLYDGEMPNDEVYGGVVVGQCFLADHNDPYGVGLYEMMRGNETIYNYVNSINTEQVVAEVRPILFGIGMTGNGNLTYKRGSNQINPLPQGAKVDKILTTGNVTLGVNFANQQKQDIEENTGVNNIVAGSGADSTLGATVILKEAALNRLIRPRNSLKQMIENDACIFFSWLEQDQIEPREFIFSTQEEIDMFVQVNPQFNVEADEAEYEYDEFGIPQKMPVYASMRVPVNFDYSQEDLMDSDFMNQNINELGDAKYVMSRRAILQSTQALDNPEQIGYDKVTLKVDANSMLVPSVEIQKQTSMQLFPIVQNAITIIYGLARQDPEQAVAQLQSLETFLETQKENIYNYIPKNSYDMIMTKQMAMPMPMMGATQADGTSVTQPQSPEEVGSSQSPMNAAVSASMTRASKQAPTSQ
jgi:hypothetical protein